MKYRRCIIGILFSIFLARPAATQTHKQVHVKKKPAAVVEKDANLPADRISIEELKRKVEAKEKIVILDNRAGSSWIGSLVKIKGAIHIPTDQIDARMQELPKDREVITYCT